MNFKEMIRILTLLLFSLSICVCEENNADFPDLSVIRDAIRNLRTSKGDLDLNSLLTQNVPDPVPLEDFNISNSGFLSDIRGEFTNLELKGLKGFQVDTISINLARNNLSAVLSVPFLNIVGDYRLEGSVTFFPLSGEGPFSLNMSDIHLKGHSILNTTAEGRLATGQIQLDSDVGDISLHFEHLLGGGAWGSLSNSLLNQLSELLLGELKPSLLRELSAYLKQQLDGELFGRLPEGFFEGTSLLDALIEKAAPGMPDPMPLPPYTQEYERNLLWVRTRAELALLDGSVLGLRSLSRSGDVVAELVNDSLVFRAEFEFANLTGQYDWKATAIGTSTTGKLQMQIKSISGTIRIRQELKSGSLLELEDFSIKEVRHLWLDLQGLGTTWDFLAESVINLITNGLKLQFADAIAEPAAASLRQQLHTINLGLVD